MVVSLLRVIYTGLQDERLLPPKGKPAFEFFTKVFIKAGRFTTAWVRLDFDTRPNFATQASITLPRQGHLITRLYLVTTMPDIVGPQLLARAAVIQGSQFVGPTLGGQTVLDMLLSPMQLSILEELVLSNSMVS